MKRYKRKRRSRKRILYSPKSSVIATFITSASPPSGHENARDHIDNMKNRVGGKRSSFLPTFVFRPLTPPRMRFRTWRFFTMDAFRILRKTLPRHHLQPSICRSALLYTLRIPSYLFKGSPILLSWFYAFIPTNGSFQFCRLNSRPLKSPFLRDIVQTQYLAYFLKHAPKSFHGSFEVIGRCRQKHVHSISRHTLIKVAAQPVI